MNHPESGMKGSAPMPTARARQLSPEELMAWANQEEQNYMDMTRQAEQPHMSAVEPTLQRSDSNGTPAWLEEYMSGPADPLDSLSHGKHALERETLLQLKR